MNEAEQRRGAPFSDVWTAPHRTWGGSILPRNVAVLIELPY